MMLQAWKLPKEDKCRLPFTKERNHDHVCAQLKKGYFDLQLTTIPGVCIHLLLQIFHRPLRHTSHALHQLLCKQRSLFSPTS
jgi:hypothetical protein